MAEISREFLEQHIATIRNQIAAYTGALQFAETLLEHLDAPEDSLSVQDFAEMVAGPGAKATVQENHNEMG